MRAIFLFFIIYCVNDIAHMYSVSSFDESKVEATNDDPEFSGSGFILVTGLVQQVDQDLEDSTEVVILKARQIDVYDKVEGSGQQIATIAEAQVRNTKGSTNLTLLQPPNGSKNSEQVHGINDDSTEGSSSEVQTLSVVQDESGITQRYGDKQHGDSAVEELAQDGDVEQAAFPYDVPITLVPSQFEIKDKHANNQQEDEARNSKNAGYLPPKSSQSDSIAAINLNQNPIREVGKGENNLNTKPLDENLGKSVNGNEAVTLPSRGEAEVKGRGSFKTNSARKCGLNCSQNDFTLMKEPTSLMPKASGGMAMTCSAHFQKEELMEVETEFEWIFTPISGESCSIGSSSTTYCDSKYGFSSSSSFNKSFFASELHTDVAHSGSYRCLFRAFCCKNEEEMSILKLETIFDFSDSPSLQKAHIGVIVIGVIGVLFASLLIVAVLKNNHLLCFEQRNEETQYELVNVKEVDTRTERNSEYLKNEQS